MPRRQQKSRGWRSLEITSFASPGVMPAGFLLPTGLVSLAGLNPPAGFTPSVTWEDLPWLWICPSHWLTSTVPSCHKPGHLTRVCGIIHASPIMQLWQFMWGRQQRRTYQKSMPLLCWVRSKSKKMMCT